MNLSHRFMFRPRMPFVLAHEAAYPLDRMRIEIRVDVEPLLGSMYSLGVLA